MSTHITANSSQQLTNDHGPFVRLGENRMRISLVVAYYRKEKQIILTGGTWGCAHDFETEELAIEKLLEIDRLYDRMYDISPMSLVNEPAT